MFVTHGMDRLPCLRSPQILAFAQPSVSMSYRANVHTTFTLTLLQGCIADHVIAPGNYPPACLGCGLHKLKVPNIATTIISLPVLMTEVLGPLSHLAIRYHHLSDLGTFNV